MVDVFKGLYRLPKIQLTESPASWICRAALSQGTTWKELCSYLQVPVLRDLDLGALRWLHRVDVRRRSAELRRLGVARDVLTSTLLVDPLGKQFLLCTSKGQARYRYCPQCFAGQQEQYLPIEWRFRAWRMCPLHDCLLQEACPQCGAQISLPFDFIATAGREMEITSFGQCLSCGYELKHADAISTSDPEKMALTGWSQMMLRNGRATLSALYHGKVWLGASAHARPLSELRRLDRFGMIPHLERGVSRGQQQPDFQEH